MKKLIIGVPLVLIIIGLSFWWFSWSKPKVVPTVKVESFNPKIEVIGKSVQNRNINAYSYGQGSSTLIFVGGIHGQYEGNSILLSSTFMDYLKTQPEIIPKNLTVTVIPNANPDGVGRFNANNVDLNRNFDCNWQATSTWQNKIVSAGTSVFSEPEARALRDFILKIKPAAVIFWHSQSNAVYASQCRGGILPATESLMNTYAQASGYPPVKVFGAYATTGAADDWLASIGIPAITVELKTHEAIEWDKNLAGVKAVFANF